MSLATWKKEFYPTPADSIKTEFGAIKHSLRKWKGLTPANLERHGMQIRSWGFDIYNDNGARLSINSWSCSLCHLSRDEDGHLDCAKCPIKVITGNTCRYDGSPWDIWGDKRNPLPMIRLLERTLKGYQKGGKK